MVHNHRLVLYLHLFCVCFSGSIAWWILGICGIFKLGPDGSVPRSLRMSFQLGQHYLFYPTLDVM